MLAEPPTAGASDCPLAWLPRTATQHTQPGNGNRSFLMKSAQKQRWRKAQQAPSLGEGSFGDPCWGTGLAQGGLQAGTASSSLSAHAGCPAHALPAGYQGATQAPRDHQKIHRGLGSNSCSTNTSTLTAKGCFPSWGGLAKDKPIVQTQNTVWVMAMINKEQQLISLTKLFIKQREEHQGLQQHQAASGAHIFPHPLAFPTLGFSSHQPRAGQGHPWPPWLLSAPLDRIPTFESTPNRSPALPQFPWQLQLTSLLKVVLFH